MKGLVEAFQAGVAGTPGDVPAAMSQTHDAVIAQWGILRTSGVSWLLFGPDAALPFARLRSQGATAMAGTLEEGWERLADMYAGGEAPIPADYLPNMQRWAARQPQPVLVIAFIQASDPDLAVSTP
jgi:hypothetical protein